MPYLRLLYELPAVVSGTTMIAYLLPFRFAPRFGPLLMFLVSLAVLAVPENVSLALALMIPAAWLQNVLGIDMHGHDPLVLRLPKIRLRRPVITEYADKAYPDPGDSVQEEAPREAAQETRIRKFVPSLLG